MDTITKSFLRQKFSEYYARAEIPLPRGFAEREWAFVSVDSLPDFVMNRHMAFESDIEFRGYVIKNPPLHAYYSSAYYENPGAERMDDKGWKGADLIFDIDADHLPKGGLEGAKRQIIRLYDLLEEDFGVEDMTIVFSGGRGYHIHVHDEEFRQMGSGERREIVDYLMLEGVEFSETLPQTSQHLRVGRCMARIIERAIEKGKVMEVLGVRKSTAERLETVFPANREKIYGGDFRQLPKPVRGKLPALFRRCVEHLRIHVDPPVTADVKRLIRLPGSLHGKTSLRVTPLSRDEVEGFDPFEDAVAFGDEGVRVRVKTGVRFRLMGEEFRLSRGKHTLPEFAALYLICRNVALYGW
ncbi:DNA primase small subunit [Geoglobus ahangari]|uniref:DNA primase small subunit PriS n=1 Tax=Geoglobus ahangari TaxID=113653 RepID=A0A0F7DBQ8_9EURY|nr:DNA primase catalytic subunit PriS [Geoglobus ahangari]AKG91516.1 DNA primase small subunit [Geoglobus ahangari]